MRLATPHRRIVWPRSTRLTWGVLQLVRSARKLKWPHNAVEESPFHLSQWSAAALKMTIKPAARQTIGSTAMALGNAPKELKKKNAGTIPIATRLPIHPYVTLSTKLFAMVLREVSVLERNSWTRSRAKTLAKFGVHIRIRKTFPVLVIRQ